MRFEYTPSVRELIEQEQDRARTDGRKIACVWLTEAEWEEFAYSHTSASLAAATALPKKKGIYAMWDGVPIKVHIPRSVHISFCRYTASHDLRTTLKIGLYKMTDIKKDITDLQREEIIKLRLIIDSVLSLNVPTGYSGKFTHGWSACLHTVKASVLAAYRTI